ncbi:hypothetical protein LCGC14_1210090 [marine sediment metagenome]|uniref:Uncharacterized protein n=1 Tax=marine sediment metagenome TaxID=412755 RepID=A0A0F9PJ17_9ZZZZ
MYKFAKNCLLAIVSAVSIGYVAITIFVANRVKKKKKIKYRETPKNEKKNGMLVAHS